MKIIQLLFISTVLLCVSCSVDKKPSDDNYPVKITEENGVKIISNPDYPKEGIYDIILEEKFTLGKEEDNSKYIFGIPVDIKLDKNNNLYVLDYDVNKLFVFNKNGKYLRTIGRKGNGPGDFETPVYFNITSDGKIVLNDARNARICFLDSLGNYLGGVPYKSFHASLELDSKNNGYITYKKDLGGPRTSQMRVTKTTETIKKVDPANGKLQDVCTYPGASYLTWQSSDGMSWTRSLSDGFWWIITPSDKLITGVAELYEFTVSGLDGKPLYKLNRKFSPFVNKEYKEGPGESRYLPAFTRYTIPDDKGNLWVNIENGNKPEYYIYDIFSEDGVFQKQVYSRYTFNLIKGDMAYFITHPASKEVPVIRAFKLSLKKRQQ